MGLEQMACAAQAHTFICWLLAHHRLLTSVRFKMIGVKDDDHCLLCGMAPETFAHLFFECHFSHQLLEAVSQWILWAYSGKSISGLWFWIEHSKGKSLFVQKVFFSAACHDSLIAHRASSCAYRRQMPMALPSQAEQHLPHKEVNMTFGL